MACGFCLTGKMGLVRNLTPAEIGQILAISALTVKSHLQKIYRKLHVHNRAQAASHATRRFRHTAVTLALENLRGSRLRTRRRGTAPWHFRKPRSTHEVP